MSEAMNTMEQATESKLAQKVAEFVSWVKQGRSFTDAWERVTANSTLGQALRKQLQDRCVMAGNAAAKSA